VPARIEVIQANLRVLAGRDAPLYHWMGRDKARKCFNSDKLRALFSHKVTGKKKGVSLTRNRQYDHGWSSNDIRLTLDQAALSTRYKIIPLDADRAAAVDTKKNLNNIYPDRGRRLNYSDQQEMAEEFLLGDIIPLHSYLTGVYYTHDGHDDDPFLKALIRFVVKFSIKLTVRCYSNTYKEDFKDAWEQFAPKDAEDSKVVYIIKKVGDKICLPR